MTEAPVVAVRGEATLEVDAEIAEFTATVELWDRNRVTALNRVADGSPPCVRCWIDSRTRSNGARRRGSR
jgi:hypothetical protein